MALHSYHPCRLTVRNALCLGVVVMGAMVGDRSSSNRYFCTCSNTYFFVFLGGFPSWLRVLLMWS